LRRTTRQKPAKAIDFFHIEPAAQFRVVVTKLEKVKKAAEPAV
jgi:hypothetical protein